MNIIEHVENAIRLHLSHRPDSADTLEGIHRWWINWEGNEESITITEQALQRLKENGLVESSNIGGREIWRRAR